MVRYGCAGGVGVDAAEIIRRKGKQKVGVERHWRGGVSQEVERIGGWREDGGVVGGDGVEQKLRWLIKESGTVCKRKQGQPH